MGFAGLPPTILYGATSLTTKELAAMTAPSPIVMPWAKVTFCPIQTSLPIFIFFFGSVECVGGGLGACVYCKGFHKARLRAIKRWARRCPFVWVSVSQGCQPICNGCISSYCYDFGKNRSGVRKWAHWGQSYAVLSPVSTVRLTWKVFGYFYGQIVRVKRWWPVQRLTAKKNSMVH